MPSEISHPAPAAKLLPLGAPAAKPLPLGALAVTLLIAAGAIAVTPLIAAGAIACRNETLSHHLDCRYRYAAVRPKVVDPNSGEFGSLTASLLHS